jgi:hypothetical protein
LAVSVILVLVAVASGIGHTVGSTDKSALTTTFVAATFVVAFGYGAAVTAPMMRHWVAGRSVPRRFYLLQRAARGNRTLVDQAEAALADSEAVR